jgi:hypothetical protein
MAARYVKTKIFKRTIGKACIVGTCSKSAKVVTWKINHGMRTEVSLCTEHAAERGLTNAA